MNPKDSYSARSSDIGTLRLPMLTARSNEMTVIPPSILERDACLQFYGSARLCARWTSKIVVLDVGIQVPKLERCQVQVVEDIVGERPEFKTGFFPPKSQ